MSIFYPTALRERITDITPEELRAMGVRGLLLDVDNTLTRFHSQELSEDVRAWLNRMEAEGFAMTIVSNGWPRRVRPFAEKVGLRSIAFACKPSPIGYFRAARRLRLPLKECVAIGDQVFTDVLAARLAGIRIIQLMPIELETDRPTIMFKRRLEKGIVRRYRARQEDMG